MKIEVKVGTVIDKIVAVELIDILKHLDKDTNNTYIVKVAGDVEV